MKELVKLIKIPDESLETLYQNYPNQSVRILDANVVCSPIHG